MLYYNYDLDKKHNNQREKAMKSNINNRIINLIKTELNNGTDEDKILEKIIIELKKYGMLVSDTDIARYQMQIEHYKDKLHKGKIYKFGEEDKIKVRILFYISKKYKEDEIIDLIYNEYKDKGEITKEKIKKLYSSVTETIEKFFDQLKEDIRKRAFNSNNDIYKVQAQMGSALFYAVKNFLEKMDHNKDDFKWCKLAFDSNFIVDNKKGKVITITHLLSECISIMIEKERGDSESAQALYTDRRRSFKKGLQNPNNSGDEGSEIKMGSSEKLNYYQGPTQVE